MCGIFGIALSDNPHLCNKDIKHLAAINAQRGNRGFGGLVISPQREVIFRYAREFDNWHTVIPKGNIVLCHLLAPTGNDKRIHPFETDRFVLAHNGILLNYEQYTTWKIGPVDSQYILGGIQYFVDDYHYDPLTAIIRVNETLQGQRACWMWDKIERKLYLWRVMSPIFFRNGREFIFSSTRFPEAQLMEEGVVFEVDYQTRVITQDAKFKFYSPYMTEGA